MEWAWAAAMTSGLAVHGRVDGERGRVDRATSLDDLTGVADEDQVRDADMAELMPKGFTQK